MWKLEKIVWIIWKVTVDNLEKLCAIWIQNYSESQNKHLGICKDYPIIQYGLENVWKN